MDITQQQTLIDKFSQQGIEFNDGPTLFSIAGFPHRETVFCNVLAFYMNPNRKHSLETKLLNIITDTDFEDLGQDRISIKKEYQTLGKGRLDLVVDSPDIVIGIEVKVHHWVANDLEDYKKSIEALAGARKSKVILLSKYKEKHLPDPWVNVTWSEVIAHLRNNEKELEPRDQIIIEDLIRSFSKRFMMNEEQKAFILKNRADLGKLNEVYTTLEQEYWDKFFHGIDQLTKQIRKETDNHFKVKSLNDYRRNDHVYNHYFQFKRHKFMLAYYFYLSDQFEIRVYHSLSDEVCQPIIRKYSTRSFEPDDYREAVEYVGEIIRGVIGKLETMKG